MDHLLSAFSSSSPPCFVSYFVLFFMRKLVQMIAVTVYFTVYPYLSNLHSRNANPPQDS